MARADHSDAQHRLTAFEHGRLAADVEVRVVLPGSGHARKVLHSRRGPYRDRHVVAERGVGPGDRSCRPRRHGSAGEQVTDARGGCVERGRVGYVDSRHGRQHRLAQTATTDEIEVRAGRHVEPRRDTEPGAYEAGQRGALASDHPGRGARVVQSHHQRHLSIHEIPPASMPGGVSPVTAGFRGRRGEKDSAAAVFGIQMLYTTLYGGCVRCSATTVFARSTRVKWILSIKGGGSRRPGCWLMSWGTSGGADRATGSPDQTRMACSSPVPGWRAWC